MPDDEPYPEEKDYSTPEETNESEELNAEINGNESDPDDHNETANEDDNDSKEDETVREKRENDDEDDDDDDIRGDQPAEADDDNDSNTNDEVPSLFEDSTPFEEEVKRRRRICHFLCSYSIVVSAADFNVSNDLHSS